MNNKVFFCLLLVLCLVRGDCSVTNSVLQCNVTTTSIAADIDVVNSVQNGTLVKQFFLDFAQGAFKTTKSFRITTLNSNVSISGQVSPDGTILTSIQSTNRKSSLFAVEQAASVTVNGMNFENNIVTSRGACFSLVDAKMITFNQCSFIGNSATESGGAMHIKNADTLKISNCVFDKNGILSLNIGLRLFAQEYTKSADYAMLDNTFINNVPSPKHLGRYRETFEIGIEADVDSAFGGAISLLTAKKVDIQFSTFSANFALFGGALNLRNVTSATIFQSLFQANKATTQGSAIFLSNAKFNSSVNTFISNECAKIRCRLIYDENWIRPSNASPSLNTFRDIYLVLFWVFFGPCVVNAFILMGCACYDGVRHRKKKLDFLAAASFNFEASQYPTHFGNVLIELLYSITGLPAIARYEFDLDTIKSLFQKKWEFAMVVLGWVQVICLEICLICGLIFSFAAFSVNPSFYMDSADWARAFIRQNRVTLFQILGTTFLVALGRQVKNESILVVWKFDKVTAFQKFIAFVWAFLVFAAGISLIVLNFVFVPDLQNFLFFGYGLIMIYCFCLVVLTNWFEYYSTVNRMQDWFNLNVVFAVKKQVFSSEVAIRRFESMKRISRYDDLQAQIIVIGVIFASLSGALLFSFASNVLSDNVTILFLPLGVCSIICVFFFIPLVLLNQKVAYFKSSYMSSMIQFLELQNVLDDKDKNFLFEGKSWIQRVVKMSSGLYDSNVYAAMQKNDALEGQVKACLLDDKYHCEYCKSFFVLYNIDNAVINAKLRLKEIEDELSWVQNLPTPAMQNEELIKELVAFQLYLGENNIKAAVFGYEINIWPLIGLVTTPPLFFSALFGLFSQIEAYCYYT